MRRRWSDNDRNWGPFTLSRDGKLGSQWTWAVMLDTGDDEYPGLALRLRGFGWTFIAWLPQIVQPWREKVFARTWDAATIARLGRDWYYNVFPREFGFTCSEGFLSVHYGPQTHDSDTTKSWGYFLPWKDWRHVRHSYYGLQGERVADEPIGRFFDTYDERKRIQASIPTRRFLFRDYDGEEIVATARIEERQWERGTKWCQWLSWFWPSRIRRSLDLEFSKEVGPEKGSWKGGTIGHGIDMLPGELHEAAFRRYCEQKHQSRSGRFQITFIGDAP